MRLLGRLKNTPTHPFQYAANKAGQSHPEQPRSRASLATVYGKRTRFFIAEPISPSEVTAHRAAEIECPAWVTSSPTRRVTMNRALLSRNATVVRKLSPSKTARISSRATAPTNRRSAACPGSTVVHAHQDSFPPWQNCAVPLRSGSPPNRSDRRAARRSSLPRCAGVRAIAQTQP